MKNVKINSIIAELKVGVMDYCDWICWLWYQKEELEIENINLIKLTDYIGFYNSDDEDAEMKLEWTDVDEIYGGALAGVDPFNESSFVSATCDEVEKRLIVRLLDRFNKVNAFVLEVEF